MKLQKSSGALAVVFDQCCHGGSRKVSRKWLTNLKELGQLRASCQGDHVHLPFGGSFQGDSFKFATADEAAYPELLCSRVSAIVAEKALSMGISLSPPGSKAAASSCEPQPQAVPVAVQQPSKTPALRAQAGKQPRGQRFPS